MAESYRGLTIRIGGDTTALTKSLRTANGAIAGTESELRKLRTALRLDPSNLEAYNLQMGYMASKASETAMKLQQLKAASEQVAARQMKVGFGEGAETATVAELAAKTEDASLAAEMAKARYNQLTESLAKMNTKVSELAQEASRVKLGEIATEFSKIPVGGKIDELLERFKGMPSTIAPSTEAIERLRTKLQSLSDAFLATDGADARKALLEEYRSLIDEMGTVSVPTFNFDNGNISVSEIRTALEDIAGIIGLDQAKIDAFVGRVAELKTEFKSAKSELERAQIVQQFEDLQVEITKTESTIASVNRAMASLAVPSETARGMYDISENVKLLENAFNSLKSTSATLGKIVEADPTNVQAMTVAMHVLAEAEKTVSEEAARVKQQMESYDASAVAKYTDSSVSAAQQLNDSAVAAEKASDAYARLSGQASAWQRELMTLENQVTEETLSLKAMSQGEEDAAATKQLLADAAAKSAEGMAELRSGLSQGASDAKAMAEADEGAAAAGRNLGDTAASNAARMAELRQRIAESTPELERLRQESSEASQALEMSKARSELESLAPKLVEVEGRLDSIRAAATRMATTLTEALKSRSVADMFGDTTAVVANFTNDFKAAVQRADVFGAAFDSLPANATLAEEKVSSLTGAISSGQRAIAALQAAMSKMDPSVVDGIRTAYGSVEAAIRETTAETVRLTEKQLAAREAMAALISENGNLGGISERLLNPVAGDFTSGSFFGNDEFGALPEKIRSAYVELARLTQELGAAREASATAAQAGQWETYRSQLTGTQAEVAKLRGEIEQMARSKVDVAIDTEVRQAFGEIIDKVHQYDAAIQNATNRGKELREAFKVTGDGGLNDQAMRSFAEAEQLAAEKAQLIRTALSQLDGSHVDALREKHKSLTAAASATREEYAKTEAEIGRLKQRIMEFANTAKDKTWVGSITDGKVAISEFPPKVQDAIARLRELQSVSFSQEISAQVAAVSAKMEELGVDAATAGAKVQASLTQATKTNVNNLALSTAIYRVSQLATQAGREITEAANTIDASFRNMRKTVQASEEDFQALYDSAVNFSQTHAVSTDTILEMEALGGQLGIAASSLQEFGEVASNLDIATDIDAETIALQLGQITNVMGDLDESTFENFADALVRLGNNMAAQESSIMNVAQRMSSVANVAQMGTPELLAWSAAIASTGQRSESAATAISNTLTGIASAVAAGGKDLEGFASVAGMAADDFAEKWRTDPSEALLAFVEGLQTLSDDNTGAIEALENMGIKSVRQQNALLGLASTVENLDEAMQMSRDAFNGGGDAAEEAAKKSEGFSGKLQILKNNASNLAASLGDGMMPYMEALTGALSLATDALNSMPGPMKAVVVGIGGVTAAAGLLSMTLRALGIDVTIQKLTSLVTSTGNASVSLKGLGAAAKLMASDFRWARSQGISMGESFTYATTAGNGATASFTALAGAANVAKAAFAGLGVGLAITAVMALVSAVADAIDKQNKLREAEDSLTAATSRLRDAANGAVPAEKNLKDEVENVSVSVSEATDYIQGLIEKQNQLAEQFENQNLEFSVKTDLVNEALEKVEELAQKGEELSAVEQADLISSIAILNDQLGMTLEVADPAAMSIKNMGDDASVSAAQIAAMAQEALGLSEQSKLVDQYVEARKSLAEAEDELAEKTAIVNELQAQGADDVSSSLVPSTREAMEANLGHVSSIAMMTDSYKNAKTELNAAQDSYDSLKGSVEDLERQLRDSSSAQIESIDDTRDAVHDLMSSSSDLNSAMAELGRTDIDLEQLADQFVYLGGTEEDFASLTAAQLAEVVRAYNGTASSVEAALAALGVSLSKAVSQAASAGKDLSVKPDDSAVRSFKNDQDAAYTAAKRAGEDYYTEQKNLRDAYYNDEKRRLDNEYDNLKRFLDNAYDARKDELDAEYSAAKSASDKWLSQFKESQEKEVAAFKAATDSKIDDIEREYEAKKELLNLEYQRYDDEFSAQIQALKDEEAAEEKARKQQERSEKMTSLTDAVATARTNKSRKEAEKALADYKAELAREDTKAQRDAQIEQLENARSALKDQLKDREDHLKTSYDSAVASYKAEREAQLEILQEYQSAEYDSQKELEEAKLAAMKAAHESELSMIKDANEIQLDNQKDMNDAYLEEVKRRHDAELTDIKRVNEDELTALKNLQTEAYEAFKKGGMDAVDALSQTADSIEAIAKRLVDNGQISTDTYLGIVNKVPGAMSTIFEEMGLTVDTGLGEVAKKMLDSGTLTRDQYEQVMAGLPGSTRLICNETGIAIAEELGLFNEPTANAAKNLKNSATNEFSTMPADVKAKSDEAGAAAGSLGGQDAVNRAGNNSKTLYDAVMSPLTNLDSDGRVAGKSLTEAVAGGIGEGADKAVSTAGQTADAIKKTIAIEADAETLGANAAVGWNNGFVKCGADALANVAKWANDVIATIMSTHQEHSPSRKFAWLAEMALKGYVKGWEAAEDGTLRMVRGTAREVADAMDMDASGITWNVADSLAAEELEVTAGMRRMRETVKEGLADLANSTEARLAEQGSLMGSILEQSFDPTLSLEAAFQAIDKIDAAELRRQQTIAKSSSTSNDNRQFSINVTIPEMVVREEADVNRISQQIAVRIQRQLRSAIG